MKFCIVTNSNKTITKNTIDYVGYYQWANVFNGSITSAKDLLPSLEDNHFDIIQVRLSKHNIPIVQKIRQKIGEGSKTKIVVCIDLPSIFWQNEFVNPDCLKEAVALSDFAFATEYTIAHDLESLCGRRIIEIPHPADIEKLKSLRVTKDNNKIAVLYHDSFKGYNSLSRKSRDLSVKLIVPTFASKRKNLPSGRNLEVIYCNTQQDIISALSDCVAFISPYPFANYGKLVIYASALKCMAIGNISTDAHRKCYANTLLQKESNNIIKFLRIYFWYRNNVKQFDHLLDTAYDKLEIFNWENIKKLYLDNLYSEVKEQRFNYHYQKDKCISPLIRFYQEMHHAHGKKQVDLKLNEVGVVCPVRNGMSHIPKFLEYYRYIGAKHFFFIDNGSTDNTVGYLKQYDDVTLYQTKLLHKQYESEIRSTIVKEHFRGKWCLGVDVDEFFDYPGSDKISFQQFIDYLNNNKYTAVLAYLLDMFASETAFSNSPNEDMFDKYCYYDNSHLIKRPYFAPSKVYCNYNRLSYPGLKFYCGGIRRKLFGGGSDNFYLVKHPLFFMDGKLEPFTNPHYSNKAYIADVSCILKHYKFVASFKEKVATLKNAYDFYTQKEYEEYHKVIRDKQGLNLYSKDSQKFESINQLIEEGFIYVSPEYSRQFNINTNNSPKVLLQLSKLLRLSQNSL